MILNKITNVCVSFRIIIFKRYLKFYSGLSNLFNY